jgi:uncharacterized coiled-coil protein SlyX
MSRLRVIDLEKRVAELEAEAEKTKDILAFISAVVKDHAKIIENTRELVKEKIDECK